MTKRRNPGKEYIPSPELIKFTMSIYDLTFNFDCNITTVVELAILFDMEPSPRNLAAGCCPALKADGMTTAELSFLEP